PVLDTLAFIRHQTDCWLEITTLLIPGLNDGREELEQLSRWVLRELGPDVPLHFSAFHPDHKMRDIPATPPATLVMARQVAMAEGLRYVYTGNVHNREGDTTFCPQCRSAILERDWYEIRRYALTPQGACPHCGFAIAGRFDAKPGTFGRKRIPVRIRA
ncbi:MAG TPA: AmmeMemoRadiSam system radical SAM enzyme, partial [Ramlibacter sp.]|nr:AmmeMemoRadiSam system radical SAM enzyme [Ramlibacter sp.]